jgi:hypothetical protein
VSTNISEIMFEIESYGMPKDRVEAVVRALVIAGQRSVWASLGEMAGKRLVNLRDVETIVGGLIAADQSKGKERVSQSGH